MAGPMQAEVPREFGKSLRACVCCRLVKTFDQVQRLSWLVISNVAAVPWQLQWQGPPRPEVLQVHGNICAHVSAAARCQHCRQRAIVASQRHQVLHACRR